MPDRTDHGIACRVCGATSSVAFYVAKDGGYLCETHHAEIDSAEIDTTTDDDESDCPECGCVNTPLGILGTTVHYRCRACGAEYYRRAQAPEAPEAPEAPDVATRINRACASLHRVEGFLRVISWSKDSTRTHPLGTLGYYSPSLEDALTELEVTTNSVRVLYDQLREYRVQLANEPCEASEGFACADCVNSAYCSDQVKRAHSAHSYGEGTR